MPIRPLRRCAGIRSNQLAPGAHFCGKTAFPVGSEARWARGTAGARKEAEGDGSPPTSLAVPDVRPTQGRASHGPSWSLETPAERRKQSLS